MKILYDHTIFQNQQYGGISRYFYELITRITKTEDTNLFQGCHINKYDLSLNKELYNSYQGYTPNLRISPSIKPFLFLLPNKVLFNKFYKNLKNIDIYHPTYYYQSIKKNHKYPIVLTVYDMIHELYPNQLRYSKYTIDAKRISINTADKIICISNNTKKDLMEIYNVPEDKIEVIYLANSLPKSTNYLNITKEFGIRKPYLLYVGDRNAPYKNFSTLLGAYLTSMKDRFNLVCFGGGSFNKNETTIINNSKCTSKITQLSGTDHLLTSLYKNAFAFICPSHYEGFGLPLLEAMGSGCPVIAADTSSIPEVVGKAALLFDPSSKNNLINKIEHLESNKILRENLIYLGFEQEKQFTWDKTANETLKLYSTL